MAVCFWSALARLCGHRLAIRPCVYPQFNSTNALHTNANTCYSAPTAASPPPSFFLSAARLYHTLAHTGSALCSLSYSPTSALVRLRLRTSVCHHWHLASLPRSPPQTPRISYLRFRPAFAPTCLYFLRHYESYSCCSLSHQGCLRALPARHLRPSFVHLRSRASIPPTSCHKIPL